MNKERQEQLLILKERFEANMKRHQGLDFKEVEARLEEMPEKLDILIAMEKTGGEPDMIEKDEKSGEYLFFDCSPESPLGRRNLCYDKAALDSRRENKPAGDAVSMAADMGIELLDEAGYRRLQETGEYDKKTSSWVLTPASIREKGGAVFCDYRYGTVFLYHNGATSYYGVRGFRGSLRV